MAFQIRLAGGDPGQEPDFGGEDKKARWILELQEYKKQFYEEGRDKAGIVLPHEEGFEGEGEFVNVME